MNRLLAVLRFIVRNWPLKLGAVVLAMLLYAGLVLSQATQQFHPAGGIPIAAVGQRSDVTILSDLGAVREVRFFAPEDLGLRIDSSTFHATVDLSGAPASGGSIPLQVHVVAADPRIQVLDFDPTQIVVVLDTVKSRDVPVRVDLGSVPANLDTGTPVPAVTQVKITGAGSIVDKAVEAVARVQIDASGIDFDREVDLVALDAHGESLSQVDVEPPTIRVRVPVFTDRKTKTVPVTPQVVGTPAAGFEVLSPIAVDPAVVSVEGDANDLANLQSADTVPIEIAGATADVTKTVALQLPAGIQAIGSTTVTVTVHLRAVSSSRTFQAGLVLKGARSDLVYGLSTDRVIVTVGGSVAELDRLSGSSLVLSLDVAGLDVGAHSVVPTASLGAGLTLLGLSPNTVIVTITAPAASPSPSPS